jgi:hypothetical protein
MGDGIFDFDDKLLALADHLRTTLPTPDHSISVNNIWDDRGLPGMIDVQDE